MTKSRMRIWEMSLLLALCFSLCIGTWAQAKQAALSSELVRLHVIAVSDDEYEQALKLRVRDEVLAYISPKLDGVKSAQDAQKIISAELDGIKQAAETAAEGRSVLVTLSEEYYPATTRNFRCRRAGISRCVSYSARGRATTGGALCSRRCASPPPSRSRRSSR